MKQLIILSALFLGSFSLSTQTIKKDANGNYYAVKMAKDSTGGKPMGQTFTDTKGNVFPVMVSKNGKLYVIRTSKSGNQYKQYLKL